MKTYDGDLLVWRVIQTGFFVFMLIAGIFMLVSEMRDSIPLLRNGVRTKGVITHSSMHIWDGQDTSYNYRVEFMTDSSGLRVIDFNDRVKGKFQQGDSVRVIFDNNDTGNARCLDDDQAWVHIPGISLAIIISIIGIWIAVYKKHWLQKLLDQARWAEEQE